MGQGQGLLGRVHRRAVRADVDPPAEEFERHVQLQAQPQRPARVGPGGAAQEVEVLDRVDHERHAPGQLVVAGQVAQRVGVRRRIGDDHVVELLGQPQRLGQRVGEDAFEAGLRQGPAHEGAAPQRLAGQAQRFAEGVAPQDGRVGVEGAELDDGEGRLEVRRRVVEFGEQVPLRVQARCGLKTHALSLLVGVRLDKSYL